MVWQLIRRKNDYLLNSGFTQRENHGWERRSNTALCTNGVGVISGLLSVESRTDFCARQVLRKSEPYLQASGQKLSNISSCWYFAWLLVVALLVLNE